MSSEFECALYDNVLEKAIRRQYPVQLSEGVAMHISEAALEGYFGGLRRGEFNNPKIKRLANLFEKMKEATMSGIALVSVSDMNLLCNVIENESDLYALDAGFSRAVDQAGMLSSVRQE